MFGASFGPAENDPPLVVDANAPLPGKIASQPLKPVAGRHAQIVNFPGGIDETQLAQCRGLNVRRLRSPFQTFSVSSSPKLTIMTKYTL
jgi:hypothetical protein